MTLKPHISERNRRFEALERGSFVTDARTPFWRKLRARGEAKTYKKQGRFYLGRNRKGFFLPAVLVCRSYQVPGMLYHTEGAKQAIDSGEGFSRRMYRIPPCEEQSPSKRCCQGLYVVPTAFQRAGALEVVALLCGCPLQGSRLLCDRMTFPCDLLRC